MAGTEDLRDDYTLGLHAEDNVSPEAAKIAAALDSITRAAEAAGDELLKAGAQGDATGAKLTQQAAAWERVAARQDTVTAATKKLQAAQEELARIQGLAKAGLDAGTADPEAVSRVLDKQIQTIDRLKASLAEVRDAQEASTQAQELWESSIAKGDELLAGMAELAAATAAAFIKGSAEAAVYGQSLESLRAKFDSVFSISKQYEAEFALLTKAFATGAIEGVDAQNRALDELNTRYEKLFVGTDTLAAKQEAQREATEKQTAAMERQAQASLDAAAAQEKAASAFAATAQNAFNQTLGDPTRASGVDMGASVSGLGTPYTEADRAKRQEDLNAYGASLDQLQARFDPLFAANQKFIDGTTALAQAIRAGLLPSIELQEAALAKLVAEHEAATEAIRGTAAAAQSFQEKANAFAGVQAPLSDEDYNKRAADLNAFGNSLDAVRAKFDKVFAASKSYEAAFDELNLAKPQLSTQQYNAELDKLNAGLAKGTVATGAYAASHGQAAFATRQLGVQTVQFFSSLESGIPFMTALVEQGHQLVDVALATGTGFEVVGNAIKAAFGAMISPIGLVVTGITAVTAAIGLMSYSAESSQRTLIKLQDTLRGTRSDYLSLANEVNQASRNVAATSTASVSDARSAGATIAGSPQFSGSQQQLEDLIRLSNDLATSWGVKVPEAAKVLADAMADPAKVADDMAKKHLPEMDAELARTIERMANAGDQAGAYNVILDRLKERHDRASELMTPLQRALNETANLFTSTKTSGSSWGDVINQSVADVITHFNTLIKKLQEVRQAAKDAQTAGNTGAPTPPTTPISSAAEPFDSTVGQLPSVQTRVANATTPSPQQPDTRLPGLTDAVKNLALDAAKAVDQFNISMDKAVNLVKASPFGKLEDAGDAVNALKTALDSLGPKTDENAKRFDELSLSLQISQKAFDDAQVAAANYFDTATDKAVKATEAQAHGQQMIADSYSQGSSAIVQATAEAKAYEAAIAQGLTPGTERFTETTKALTAANLDLARSTAAVKVAEDSRNIANQIELLDAQTRAVISNTAANRDSVVAIRNRQAAQKEADAGASPDDQAHALAQRISLQASTDANTLATQAAASANKFKPADIDRLKQQNADYTAQLTVLGARTKENATDFDLWTNAIKGNDAEIARLSKTTATHVAALDKQKDTVLAQIDATDKLTVAWSQGTDAVVQITAEMKAQEKAISDGLRPGTEKYKTAVADLTNEFLRLGTSQAQLKAVQESNDIQQQIKLVELETSTLTDNNNVRELKIQHMKDEYDVQKNNMQLAPEARAALLAEKDALAQISQELTNKKQTLSYLQEQFSSAFDTIGNSITQAFVQGSGSAVKWGNVMQGVLTQVLQQFAHLAILNPLMNSLFGQNQPTLGSIQSLFGGGTSAASTGALGTALQLVNIGGKLSLVGGDGGGAAGGVGGISSLIGTQDVGASPGIGGVFGGGAIGSLAALYASGAGQTTGGAAAATPGSPGFISNLSSLFQFGSAANTLSGGSLVNSLGLKGLFSGSEGNVGLFDTGGFFGSGGTVANFLSTPLIGSVSPAATNAALAAEGFGAGGAPGVATAGAFTEAGGAVPLTVGGALGVAGGVAAGYGIGSTIGGFEQRALGKVGPAPQIGAGVGALAGAGIGFVIGNVPGAIIGGLIGGSLGGAGGGLIGPKAPSAFSSTMVNLSDGQLSVGGTASQRVDASGERAGALSDVDTINQILQQRGLTITSLAGANTNAQYFQVGQNTPGGFQDPSKYGSVGAAFPDFRFASSDATTQAVISGRSFASSDELAGVTQSLSDFENALKGTIAETDTTRLAVGALAGTANTDVQPALQHIATFITSTLPTLTAGNPGSLATAQSQVNAQFSDALNTAKTLGIGVNELTAAQQKLYDKNNQVAQAAVDATAASVSSRYLTARATVTGSPQDALNAQLVTFDANAKQQSQQLSDTLTGIYGDAYTTTSDYAQRMADNDKATAEERLAIQTQFDKQQIANQTASQEQLMTLQARVATSAAALTGSPQQIQAAQVGALQGQQAIENVGFNQSEQQTFGDSFATADPNYTAKIADLQNAQINEMASLQQSIDRQNLNIAIAKTQQDQAITVRSANASAALYPQAAAPEAARYSFEVAAQQEQQNFYIQARDSYGAAYTVSEEYYAKLNALVAVQGQERLVLEQTLAQRERQIILASAQQDQGFSTRFENAAAQISGTYSPTQDTAQLDAFNAQANAELSNLSESLLSAYGDAYAASADYGNKIAALTKAQGEERLVLEDQMQQRQLQQYVATAQQIAGYQSRIIGANATVAGTPQAAEAAQTSQLAIQQVTEQQNLAVSLRAQYGAGYATDPAARQMITLLQQAQQAEQASLAVQQRQADAQRATATTEQSADFTVRYFEAYLKRTSATPDALEAYSVTALQVQQQKERDQLRLSNTDTTGSQMQELVAAQAQETALLVQQNRQADIQRGFEGQQQDASFSVRYAVAAASVSGNQSASNAAALAQFDAQAKAEQQNLYLSLTQTYGVAYTTTVDYSRKLTALQKAEGEERLALAQQQNDALKATATSSIQSLVQYAQSLRTSSLSPLSPTAQLDIAKKEFATQSGLASSGNFAAVQTLQQYADAYLNAAHTVYGSGTNYVQAFSQVISTLASVGAASPDALTASVLASETRGQTAILVEQLQELQDEVKQLRLQISQGNLAPARV